jgi:UDP-N-acetyl-D-glucosamine dehydrogenase
VLGVTYKKDVADLRESSALEVVRRLHANGFEVLYHDPLIPSLDLGDLKLNSLPLSRETLGSVSSVVLCAPHTAVDYDLVVATAPLVLDTCNALKQHQRENVVPL